MIQMFSHLLVRCLLLIMVSMPHTYSIRTLCHRIIFRSSPSGFVSFMRRFWSLLLDCVAACFALPLPAAPPDVSSLFFLSLNLYSERAPGLR